VENRILIYAPTGKDARLIAQTLAGAQVNSFVCIKEAEISEKLKSGAGALLVVDDALSAPLLQSLTQFLRDQPTWSDLPVLILSQRGLDSSEMRGKYLQLGNVTLLERPVQGVTLVSAARSALRARRRQYTMQEVDRRKDEFLAMLAHELRNPLAPISAASDLLRFADLDRAVIQETSEIISRQVKHMTGLIDDLLDVSRVSRGLVTLDNSVVDAKQIVTHAVEQVRPLIDSRQHRLTVRTSPELAFIKGDKKRLIQILSNVLNNAAKYTPKGGDIELSMTVTYSNLIFTVIDNGIGIKSHVINHIFDMFVQAETTSDRSQGGLGIGLALVKSLVHLQGGTVIAHSDGAGKGARFTLTFPRSFESSGMPIPAKLNAQCSDKGVRVLIVDDNVDAAEMLGRFLDLVGYQVRVAHSAKVALEMAREQAPHACFLDIGLPDMDGNELAKRLRELPEISSLVLVAVTGYGQDGDRQKTFEAGFDHHLVKPVDRDKLLTTLSALSY